jgi:hypothetical protein
MDKFKRALRIVLLACLCGCSAMPSTKPLEGVSVSKVINQIKQDLAKSSIANLKVGNGSVHACGEDNKPLFLMRDPDPDHAPTVTLKLSTAHAIDVTTDVGVAKVPVLSVLFSADASYESKRQETIEQDITFAVLRPLTKDGDPMIVAVPAGEYSELGKAIDEAEMGILAADHEQHPCLRPSKVSVNVLVDITRTTAANGTVGFALLYSVTVKTSRSSEQKNQIQVDISYDKTTAAAFTER